MNQEYPRLDNANAVPDAAEMPLRYYRIICYKQRNWSREPPPERAGRGVLQGARPTAMPGTRECYPKAADRKSVVEGDRVDHGVGSSSLDYLQPGELSLGHIVVVVTVSCKFT